jgi:ACS family hexuronate transporter-like MFS transporter
MSITVTGLRWWISALLFLATLISYIDRLTLSVLAPLICRDLGLSNLEYAGIGTWFLLTYSFGRTFFGKLQDRIGTRRGLGLAMCIWSVAEIAHAAARQLASLSFVRALLGLGEDGHWPAAIKSVAEWFPAEERAFAMGIVNTGATLGSALAPPLIVWLQLRFGWQMTFIATGVLGFVWLAVWLFVYRLPGQHKWIPPGERSHILAGQTRPEAETAKADAGALLGGWMSGYLVRRGWTARRARGAAILFATLLAPVAMLVGRASSPITAMALISVVLFAFQFWVNNVQTLPSDLFLPGLVAAISGLARTGAGVGAMIFTFSTGWVVDHLGYAPILIASGLLVPIGTIFLFVRLRLD